MITAFYVTDFTFQCLATTQDLANRHASPTDTVDFVDNL